MEPTRRNLLLGALLIPALLMSGCNPKKSDDANAPATGSAPTVTLRVLSLNWPQAPVEQRLADQLFTPKTGIKVELQQFAYDAVEAKMKQVIQTKNSSYDLVYYDSQWLGQFVAANGLERLDSPAYLNDPKATVQFNDFMPEWSTLVCKYPTNADDLFAGRFEEARTTPVYGLPWATGAQILFYRKDLLAANGFKAPPQTWDEFVTVAQKLTTPTRYGAWTHAGRSGDYITQDFFPIMWAYGGRLWDAATWRAEGILNSAQNVKALQFYVDWNLKNKIVPAAAANWTNEDVLNAASQDKAAMGQFWDTFGAMLEDPKTSRVIGKMGYAVVPGVKDPATGVLRRAAMYGCQGAGITAFSLHKKEAWQYLQWLTSKETQKALLDDKASAFVTSRRDLAEYARNLNEMNKATLNSAPFAHDFWNNPDYSKLLDVMQRELNSAFIGQKTPRAALDAAASEVQTILDNSSYKSQSMTAPAPGAPSPAEGSVPKTPSTLPGDNANAPGNNPAPVPPPP